MPSDLRALFDPSRGTRILIVAAHPDDETIGFGARLAALVHGGAPRPRIAILTDGAPHDASLWPRTFSGSRADYMRLRDVELARALAEAGLSLADVERLGGLDQEAANELVALTRRLEAFVVRHAIEVVVTHPYEGGHPDHDAAAFVSRAALGGALARGLEARLVEMSSYHDEAGRLVTNAFVPAADTEVWDEPLPDAARAIKRRMLSAYASQAAILEPFGVDREPLRFAPAYDFARPPRAERLTYERLGWPMTGERFAALAAAAARSLRRG